MKRLELEMQRHDADVKQKQFILECQQKQANIDNQYRMEQASRDNEHRKEQSVRDDKYRMEQLQVQKQNILMQTEQTALLKEQAKHQMEMQREKAQVMRLLLEKLSE